MHKLSSLAIVLFSIIPYLPILWNGFAGDDLFRIVSNSLFNNATINDLSTAVLYPGDIYRPTMVIAQGLVIKFFGLHAFPLHAFSIVLHTVNGLLVFNLFRHFFKSGLALAATLLFVVHPVHSEAVANISSQSELLMCLFVLLTINFALSKSISKSVLIGCVFFFSLIAFGSKESSLAIFLLLPIMLSWNGMEDRIPVSLSALLASASLFLLARLKVLGFGKFVGGDVSPLDNPLVTLDFYERLPHVFEGLGNYLFLHLIPYPLRSDYSYAFKTAESIDIASLSFLLVSIFIVFVLVTIWSFLNRSVVRVWFYWFLAGFLVTSNFFFPIGTVFAERLVYLPSIGVLALLVCVCREYISESRRAFFLSLFLTICVFVTALRCLDWKDNYSLVSKEVVQTPSSAKNQYHYGVVLQHQGDIAGAKEHFRLAYRIYPNFVEAAHAIAMISLREGKAAETESWLEKAHDLNPKHVATLQHLGTLRAQQGNFSEALVLLSKAHTLDQDNFDVKLALLGTYINLERWESALTLYRHLERINSDNPYLKRYGKVLVDKEIL